MVSELFMWVRTQISNNQHLFSQPHCTLLFFPATLHSRVSTLHRLTGHNFCDIFFCFFFSIGVVVVVQMLFEVDNMQGLTRLPVQTYLCPRELWILSCYQWYVKSMSQFSHWSSNLARYSWTLSHIHSHWHLHSHWQLWKTCINCHLS